jgi:Zn-dependent protease
MTLQHVDIVFQVIVFLFAISVHESAHAWTAWRCGDPTARMLGRVTLNPLRHIDLFGTVILPLMALIAHFPVIGWAKPTPVNPHNFRHPVRDDIYVSVAGPISNFIVACGAVVVLGVISLSSAQGQVIVRQLANRTVVSSDSVLMPVALLLYDAMFINVLLGVFNLIPVPPLDGSHVFRHLLSDPLRRIYDQVGVFGLIALVFFGGDLLGRLLFPVVGLFNSVLMRI